MNKMVEVKATIIMSRSLYIEVPEEASIEEIISKGKQEIVSPKDALNIADNALRRVGMRVNGIDLKDWEVNSYDFSTVG